MIAATNPGGSVLKPTRDFAFVLAAPLLVLMALAYWPFKVDDAYISFVYAKNLVEGHGLTYNGLVVEGYSNFLWTVILAPFIALHWDPLLAARGLSLVLACACLWLTNQIMRQMAPASHWPIRLLPLLTVDLNAPFAAWTQGGLEPLLAAFLITLFVYVEGQPSQRSKLISPVIVLAAALTRPEGALLFPVLLVYRLAVRREPWRQVVAPALFFAVPFGVYLAWRYLTYGYLVPNTFFLKMGGSSWDALLGAQWMLGYLVLRPIIALLIAIGLLHLVRSRQILSGRWLLVIMSISTVILFVLYAGPDWMPHYRYLAPIVPLLSLFIAQSLTAFARPLVRLAMVALTVAAILMGLAMSAVFYLPLSAQLGNYTDGLIAGGEWLREHTRPEDKIAVVDSGALAYYSGRPLIDILGLNDVHIAHTPRKSDADYVLSQEPKIIQLHIGFTPTGQMMPADTTDHNLDVFNHPDFHRFYKPYAAGAAIPYFPFFFIRDDSADLP
jgi:hypothetical protein